MVLKDIGNLLRTTRQNKNFELKQIAEALKIKEKYLRAVEAGELAGIADKVYIYGCIKSYANWLGLNGEELSAQLKQSQKINSTEIIINTPAPGWYLNIFLLSRSKIYIASVMVVIIAYGILYYMQSSPSVAPLYHPVIKEMLTAERLAPYEGKGLLFVAEREVVLTVATDMGIVSGVHYLRKGEVFFIIYRKSLRITADYPEVVDVFLDDPRETFLGKMKDFL